MKKSLYEQMASSPEGALALAAARLRYDVQKILHRALSESGISQSDLSRRLGIRKSAVNQVFKGDGNLKINTLADYLHAMGYELAIEALPFGTLRLRAASSEEIADDLLESDEELDVRAITFRAFGSGDRDGEDHDMRVSEWTTLAPEPTYD